MAIRRNMSTPLSASVFDGGPKKKKKKVNSGNPLINSAETVKSSEESKQIDMI